jgi:hypothetical protein
MFDARRSNVNKPTCLPKRLVEILSDIIRKTIVKMGPR